VLLDQTPLLTPPLHSTSSSSSSSSSSSLCVLSSLLHHKPSTSEDWIVFRHKVQAEGRQAPAKLHTTPNTQHTQRLPRALSASNLTLLSCGCLCLAVRRKSATPPATKAAFAIAVKWTNFTLSQHFATSTLLNQLLSSTHH